jgi:hypothetical protein
MSLLHSFSPGGCSSTPAAPSSVGAAAPAAPRGVRPPCARCAGASPASLRVRAEFLCGPCFLSGALARSRRLLSTGPHTGGEVLLAVSGGASSRAALDVAALLMHCGRRRRWWADAAAVHVDAAPLLGAMLGVRGGACACGEGREGCDAPACAWGEGGLRGLLEATLAAGLHTYVVPLEAAFAEGLLALPVAAPDVALAPASGGGDSGCAPPPASGAQCDAGAPFAPFSGATVAVRAAEAARALAAARAPGGALHAPLAALLAAFSACGGGGARGAGGGPPRPPPTDLRQGLFEALRSRLLAQAAHALRFPFLLTAATVDRAALAVFCAAAARCGATAADDVAGVDFRFVARGLPFPAPAAAPRTLLPCGGARAPLPRLPTNWYAPGALQVAPPPHGRGAGGPLLVRVGGEVEAREAALVCRLKRLRTAPRSALDFLAAAPHAASVAGRSRELLAGLQAAFPATVHNVVRTARKLEGGGGELCRGCGGVLPRGGSGGGGDGGDGEGGAAGGAPRHPLCAGCERLQAVCGSIGV